MRKMSRRTVVAVTAGALGLGGVAVAAPALAGSGPFGNPQATASDAAPGPGAGNGAMADARGMGVRNGRGVGTMARDGSCMAATEPQGTLTGSQQAALAAIAQKEKLAHDLYAAFATKHDAVVFERIAVAENQHLAAVRKLLERYGLVDPTANKPDGQFSDQAVQADYDRLLGQGRSSLAAALGVASRVEQADIDALRAGLDGLTAADVRQVLNNLLNASQRHFEVFTR